MMDPAPDRKQDGSKGSVSETRIDSVLHLLREVEVPPGLENRVEERLRRAKMQDARAMTSHWSRARIAASVLVVVLASIGLAKRRTGSVPPVATMPAPLHHAPSSGVGAAGAIRVPTQAIVQGLTPGTAAGTNPEGHTGRAPGRGRRSMSQRAVLPHGVAVPNRPVAGAPSSNTTSNVNDQGAARLPTEEATH